MMDKMEADARKQLEAAKQRVERLEAAKKRHETNKQLDAVRAQMDMDTMIARHSLVELADRHCLWAINDSYQIFQNFANKYEVFRNVSREEFNSDLSMMRNARSGFCNPEHKKPSGEDRLVHLTKTFLSYAGGDSASKRKELWSNMTITCTLEMLTKDLEIDMDRVKWSLFELIDGYHKWNQKDTYKVFQTFAQEYNVLTDMSRERFESELSFSRHAAGGFCNPDHPREDPRKKLVRLTKTFLSLVSTDSSESRKKLWNFLQTGYNDSMLVEAL